MKATSLIVYLILLMSILVIASGTASATNYFVSTSGNDAATGLSPTTAWKTPSYAVSKVQAGDTIYMMAGTWYGEQLAFHTSGTQSAPITITSYNGKVILDGIDKSDSSIGLEVSDYTNGLEYININNIVIRNYYRGIYVRNSNNININGVEVYNTYYIGVDFIDTCQSSLVNSNIHDNGWNSVSIVAHDIDINNVLLYNNNIHDNPGTSGGSGHNLVDLFNYGEDVSVNNIDIKNNYLYNGGSSSSAVFAHGELTPMVGINFSNNVVYNTRQITLDRFKNSVIYNNTIYNQPAYGFTSIIVASDNVVLKDNTIYDVAWNELRLTGAPKGKYLILESNDMHEYRIDENYATIRDPQQSTFKVQSTLGSKIVIEFSDNKVFTTNGLNKTVFSPSSSSYTTLGDETVAFETYPMTAKPSSSNVDILVDLFDTSKPIGEVIVKFTANANNGNNVDFIISSLQPNARYLLKMDDQIYKTLTADSNGCVSFSNSFWSQHVFTLELSEISTSTPQSDQVSPGMDISFLPSSTSFAVNVGESTTFSVSGSDFDISRWYLDGIPVEIDSLRYVHNWDTSGTYIIRFRGIIEDEVITDKWTIVVSEPVISPFSSGTAVIVYSPSSSYLTANVGESTTFSVSGSDFDTSRWYLDGTPMESDSLRYVYNWDTSGTYIIRFRGIIEDEVITDKWTIIVS